MSFAASGDFIWQYGFVITLVGMIAMAANRSYGASKAWKISDVTLLLLALIGAGPGELLYMLLFRYKWNNRLFAVAIPLLAAAAVALGILLFRGAL